MFVAAAALAGILFFGGASSSRAEDLAALTSIHVGKHAITAGQKIGAAFKDLECRPNTVQHTIKRCRLKPNVLAQVSGFDHPVDEVSVTVHANGDVINLSVVFGKGAEIDPVLAAFKKSFGADPKVEYWADDEHLYASYIWIDAPCPKEPTGTEVEISRTLKGASKDERVRVYVSNLSGNRPLSDEDAKN